MTNSAIVTEKVEGTGQRIRLLVLRERVSGNDIPRMWAERSGWSQDKVLASLFSLGPSLNCKVESREVGFDEVSEAVTAVQECVPRILVIELPGGRTPV